MKGDSAFQEGFVADRLSHHRSGENAALGTHVGRFHYGEARMSVYKHLLFSVLSIKSDPLPLEPRKIF